MRKLFISLLPHISLHMRNTYGILSPIPIIIKINTFRNITKISNMNMHINSKKFGAQVLSVWVLVAFCMAIIIPCPVVYAQSPGTLDIAKDVPIINSVLLKGLRVDLENPLQFEFVLDQGPSSTATRYSSLEKEAKKLIKYFLASLTTPEKDLWVNLSPNEPQRIVPESFGQTDMGRDLLAQDYLLKQLSASLTNPDTKLGKKFWYEVHAKAYEQFGKTNIPEDMFHKVWIVPERAVVFESHTSQVTRHKNKDFSAFVVEAKLKVMSANDFENHWRDLARNEISGGMEEDLKSEEYLVKSEGQDKKDLFTVHSSLFTEIILPAIEQEINEGASFAPLRQIYHSLILASWYKKRLKKSVLGAVYMDQNKIGGIDIADKEAKQKIYAQYMDAYKQGVYSFIKEEPDPQTEKIIPRKYFSGGFSALSMIDTALITTTDIAVLPDISTDNAMVVVADLDPDGLREKNAPQATQDNASVRYEVVTDEEAERIYQGISQKLESQLQAFFERFIKGVEEGNPYINLGLSIKDVSRDLLEKERLLHEGLLKDERGRYWIIKKKESDEEKKGGMKNFKQRERFWWLLLGNKANMAEIRFLTSQQAQQISIIKDDPEDYYLTRIIFDDEQVIRDLVHKDRSVAYSSLFALELFMGKFDAHFLNFGFSGDVPVSVDQDIDPLAREGNDSDYFYWEYWYHKIYLMMRVFRMSNHSSYVGDMDSIRLFLDNNAHLFTNGITTGMNKDFGLGKGLQNAEFLNEGDIKDMVLNLKSISEDDIEQAALQAGFAAGDIPKIVEEMQRRQRLLGRNVGYAWEFLTGDLQVSMVFKELDQALEDEQFLPWMFVDDLLDTNQEVDDKSMFGKEALSLASLADFFDEAKEVTAFKIARGLGVSLTDVTNVLESLVRLDFFERQEKYKMPSPVYFLSKGTGLNHHQLKEFFRLHPDIPKTWADWERMAARFYAGIGRKSGKESTSFVVRPAHYYYEKILNKIVIRDNQRRDKNLFELVQIASFHPDTSKAREVIAVIIEQIRSRKPLSSVLPELVSALHSIIQNAPKRIGRAEIVALESVLIRHKETLRETVLATCFTLMSAVELTHGNRNLFTMDTVSVAKQVLFESMENYEVFCMVLVFLSHLARFQPELFLKQDVEDAIELTEDLFSQVPLEAGENLVRGSLIMFLQELARHGSKKASQYLHDKNVPIQSKTFERLPFGPGTQFPVTWSVFVPDTADFTFDRFHLLEYMLNGWGVDVKYNYTYRAEKTNYLRSSKRANEHIVLMGGKCNDCLQRQTKYFLKDLEARDKQSGPLTTVLTFPLPVQLFASERSFWKDSMKQFLPDKLAVLSTDRRLISLGMSNGKFPWGLKIPKDVRLLIVKDGMILRELNKGGKNTVYLNFLTTDDQMLDFLRKQEALFAEDDAVLGKKKASSEDKSIYAKRHGPGGVDFRPEGLEVEVQGSDRSEHVLGIDSAMMAAVFFGEQGVDMSELRGFSPMIRHIRPLRNLPVFLRVK